jgi:hypothetical protein
LLVFSAVEFDLAAGCFEQHDGCSQILDDFVVNLVTQELPVALGKCQRFCEATTLGSQLFGIARKIGWHTFSRGERLSGNFALPSNYASNTKYSG